MNDAIFISAFLIDIIFGDPPLLFPHPIVIIGKLIEKTETFFYILIRDKKIAGIIFFFFIIIVVFFTIKLILLLFSLFGSLYIIIFSGILGSFALSLRSLHLETLKVVDALKFGNIFEARKQLSFLVSRDTEQLEETDIIRSIIETISENTIDGVIAPLFYFVIGGLPLVFIYKAINTLDSMIGYKNEKYKYFGWFSAKIDDIFNFIPARIGAILGIIVSFLINYNWKNAIRILLRDRNNTDSPNSGWIEAVFAGALNIQIGGPTPYFGVWYDKPFIGDDIEKLSLKHIKKSYKLMYFLSCLFAIICLFIIR